MLSKLAGVPRWLIAVNLLIAGLAVFFVAAMAREFTRPHRIPPPPAPRPARTAAPPVDQPQSGAAAERLESYNVVAVKNLFNASRSEGATATTTAAVTAPLPPKPMLHGVIIDGASSLAYLEDPGTKRILVYRVGDSVAGGQLVKINSDRVLIRRADGQLDVLLSDPSKPKPPTGPPPNARGVPQRTPVGPVPPATPAAGAPTPNPNPVEVAPQPQPPDE